MNNDRVEYVAGLRALADLLEAHDEIPLPTAGRTDPFDWWLHPSQVDDPKAALAAIVRLIPGAKEKQTGEYSGASWFTVRASLRGFRIDLNTSREAVCRRVVTGTRKVTREVPAPDAPTVTVTETVEDVEWVCEPLLSAATA